MNKEFKLKKGINHCTNIEYHSDKSYFSSSNLKMLLKDPEQFYKECILGEREFKEANHFLEGTYAHSLILEPETIKDEFSFFEGWARRGKEWEKFKAANEGRIILTKPQRMRVESWVENYKKLPEATQLISGGFPEHTVAGELLGMPIKARADYINIDKGYIADVKTTGFPSDVDSFKQTVNQFSYQLSAALYLKMFEQHYGKSLEFYFIVLGKKDKQCEVYKLSDKSRELGYAMIRESISIYNNCVKTGDWTNKTKHKIKETGDYEILEV